MSASSSAPSSSHHQYSAKDLSHMISMGDLLLSTFDELGRQEGLLKLLNVDPERGIESGTIGARVQRFGDGNLRLREQTKYLTMMSQIEHDNQKKQKRMEKQKMKKKNKNNNKNNDDDDDDDKDERDDNKDDVTDDFRMGFIVNIVDRAQNRSEYEVLRDGNEEFKKVFGHELVAGDIVKLKARSRSEIQRQEQEEEEEGLASSNDNNNSSKKRKNLDSLSPWRRLQILNRHCTLIPADCVMLTGRVVQDYSECTGESVTPTCDPIRNPMLIGGAKIVDGECFALVCVVGKDSMLGNFCSWLSEEEDDDKYRGGRKCCVSCCC